MDVLANASLTHMKDDDAALILNLLRADRPPSAQDGAFDASENYPTMPAAAPPMGPWSEGEDELLSRLVARERSSFTKGGRLAGVQGGTDRFLPESSWQSIAKHFDGHLAAHCQHRWTKVLSPENVKGPWCSSEDAQLIKLVGLYGCKHWARIAGMLPGRTGKQCRERWCNNLDPTLKKGSWTPEEDMTILDLHAKLGTRWAEIAKSLPGRSDNSVKNRWYSTCSRILRQQQIEAGETPPDALEQSLVKADDAIGGDAHLGESSNGSTNASSGEPVTPARSAQSARASRTGSASRKRHVASETPPSKRASRAIPEETLDGRDRGGRKLNLRAGGRRGFGGVAEATGLPGGWEQLSANLPGEGRRDEDDGSSIGESALSAEAH